MKIKKLITSFALASVMALGVGVGIAANRNEAKGAKAVTSTTLYVAVDRATLTATYSISTFRVYLNVNYAGNSNDWSAENSLQMTDSGKTYESKPIYTITFDDKWNGLGCIQFQIKDGTEWKAQDQVFGTQTWTTPGTYNGKLHVYGGSGWMTYIDDSMVTYDVTMYAVVDGVNTGEFGTDTADAAEAYSPEDPDFRANYSFDGWYTTAACTVAYSAVAPTADFDLFAKFTHLDTAAADIIYLVTGYNTSWAGRYIYTYSSTDDGNAAKKGFGAWPGTPYSEAYLGITTAANFGGGSDAYWNGGLMKFACYDSFACDKVIIHDNNGNQVDLDIVDGAAYFYESDLSDGKYEEETGAAAAVVYAFDEEFGASDPHCSTAPAKAAELYNAWYDATLVDANVASWMESSVVTTSNIHVDVAAAAMKMIVDKANANGGSYVLHGANSAIIQLQQYSNGTIIIILISATALIAVGGFFLLRKKREN